MASPQNIRAGKAFVEVNADDSKLAASLSRIGTRLKRWGSTLATAGAAVGGIGAAALGPVGLATKSFATMEQALADLKAAANPTAGQFEAIKAAIDKVSLSTGQAGPAVASAFSELLKAGMSLDDVLGGAAESAIQFARVGEMDVAQAATVMNDAINVFAKDAVTATQAVDTLSKAADASSIGVSQIAEAFSMSAAVFAQNGQTIGDLSQAIAILGMNGVKGSDAGTSLKTALLRLATGAESAGDEMERLGINVRDAKGNMKPFRAIVAELERTIGKLTGQDRASSLMKLFGSDAIRAGSILLSQGAKGWDEFGKKLDGSLSVSEKYGIQSNTLEGSIGRLSSSFQRLGDAVGSAIGGTLREAAGSIEYAVGKVTEFVRENGRLVAVVAGVAAGLLGLGGVLTAVGLALGVAGTALGAVAALITSGIAPALLLAGAIAGVAVGLLYLTDTTDTVVGYLASAWGTMASDFSAAWQGIRDALVAGDWSLAAKVVVDTMRVAWARGMAILVAPWVWLRNTVVDTLGDLYTFLLTSFYTIRNAFQSLGISIVKAFAEPIARAFASVIETIGALEMATANAYTKVRSAVGLISDAEAAQEDAAALAGYDERLSAARGIRNVGKGITSTADFVNKENDAEYQRLMYAARLANAEAKNARAAQGEAEIKAAEADLAASIAARDTTVKVAGAKRAALEGPAKPELGKIPELKIPKIEIPEISLAPAEKVTGTEVRGLFNGSALRALAAGGNKPAEATAKNTAAALKLLQDVVNNTRNALPFV